ncbi:hypothetical protein ACFLEY_32710 [Bradyrhizobium sp. YCK136]|uniref:hypothetical protein n=1 Tax=Bradyrhizobium TaxID=374 RepID=UPI001013D4EA
MGQFRLTMQFLPVLPRETTGSISKSRKIRESNSSSVAHFLPVDKNGCIVRHVNISLMKCNRTRSDGAGMQRQISALRSERGVTRPELSEREKLLGEIRQAIKKPGDEQRIIAWLLSRLRIPDADR